MYHTLLKLSHLNIFLQSDSITLSGYVPYINHVHSFTWFVWTPTSLYVYIYIYNIYIIYIYIYILYIYYIYIYIHIDI